MMMIHYFLHYIFKMLFYKFYLTQKNVSGIFACKYTNFTDFYGKLFKKLYFCNFTLNLVKKNDVTLPSKYGNFTRSEFHGIFACLVLASATVKTFVYRISSKSIYFCYFALPYWICYFEFLIYEV